MANLYSHGYKHEQCTILQNNLLVNNDIWLEKIKKFLPLFAPTTGSENKTVYFEEGIYALDIFMNLACVRVLYNKSCNVLSEHLNSILHYLVLTIKSLGKRVEVVNHIKFQLLIYLPGDSKLPNVKGFTFLKENCMKTLLGQELNSPMSEYQKILLFNNEYSLEDTNCSISYSQPSCPQTWTSAAKNEDRLANRCIHCGIQDIGRICGSCLEKNNGKNIFKTSSNTNSFFSPNVDSQNSVPSTQKFFGIPSSNFGISQPTTSPSTFNKPSFTFGSSTPSTFSFGTSTTSPSTFNKPSFTFGSSTPSTFSFGSSTTSPSTFNKPSFIFGSSATNPF